MLTKEQARASTPEAHAWVEANAGTGKTHVLTARVLRLLLAGVAPDQILCLTYTRAGAAVMANRVQQELGRWAVLPEDELTDVLTKLTGAAPTADAHARARLLFAQVLDLPHGLPISTIHAFCQSLLGRFPLESGLSPNFTLADESDLPQLQRDAVDHVLAAAARDEESDIARSLAALAARISEYGFDELVSALISKSRTIQALPEGDDLVRALRHGLGLASDASREKILADATAATDAETAARWAGILSGGSKSDANKAEAIADWLQREARERVACFDIYMSAFLTGDGQVLKRPATKGVLERDPQLEDELRAEASRLAAVREAEKCAELAAASHALLTLGRAIVSRYERLKANKSLVDYDDLIERAFELLGRADMADWVLFKLDGGISHLLIDEAQDTNPRQWQIVDLLAQEFFAGEGARDELRSLFAVGDVKQSIYGFQGAAPEKFALYRTLFKDKAAAISAAFRSEALGLSFRSTKPVLDLVDAVFSGPDAPALGLDHEMTPHRARRADAPGRVELWPIVWPQKDEAGGEDWQPPTRYETLDPPAIELANEIADKISVWLREREILTARGRPMRPGDIMILVRRRNIFQEHMVRALKIRDVPVAGIDRLDIKAPLAVQDLIAAGRFALLPEDDFNLAVLLKSPFVGLDDDQLFALAHGRAGSLWRALRAREAEAEDFARAVRLLRALLADADYMPPFEFYARLLGALAGREKLLARLGEEADEYIDQFLAEALAFERSHAASLEGFVDWISNRADEIKRDPEQSGDAVRVMTVHGAKGLEAPIVILPDTCGLPDIKTPLLDVDAGGARLPYWYRNKGDMLGPVGAARRAAEAREMAEYQRLLYVAMTRAEDRLYVCGWMTKTKFKRNCWYASVARGFAKLLGRDVDPETLSEPLAYFNKDAVPAERRAAQAEEAPPKLPAWADVPPGGEPAPPRPLAPSRFDEPVPAPDSPLAEDRESALLRGNLVHKLLEYLPDIAPERRRAKIAAYLDLAARDMPTGARAEIAGAVEAVLEAPAAAALWGEGSVAEANITALIGKRALSGQIDRLVVRDDEILIADYKTNRAPPERVEDTPPPYLRQLAAYRAAMRQIHPDRAVRCFIVWTATPALVELPSSLLDEHSVSDA